MKSLGIPTSRYAYNCTEDGIINYVRIPFFDLAGYDVNWALDRDLTTAFSTDLALPALYNWLQLDMIQVATVFGFILFRDPGRYLFHPAR